MSLKYYLKKAYKMSKTPEWIMLFVVIFFSTLTYCTSQTAIKIAETSNQIANESKEISEISLEVAKSAYTILGLEKTPKVIVVDEPSCYNFNSYRDVEIKLRNIGGIYTNCTTKLSATGFHCLRKGDTSYTRYLFNERRTSWDNGEYYSYERKKLSEFIDFTERYGNFVCEEEIWLESQEGGIVKFSLYMEPGIENESITSFKFEYSCENPIFKEVDIENLDGCNYLVDRPLSKIPFARFIELNN